MGTVSAKRPTAPYKREHSPAGCKPGRHSGTTSPQYSSAPVSRSRKGGPPRAPSPASPAWWILSTARFAAAKPGPRCWEAGRSRKLRRDSAEHFGSEEQLVVRPPGPPPGLLRTSCLVFLLQIESNSADREVQANLDADRQLSAVIAQPDIQMAWPAIEHVIK